MAGGGKSIDPQQPDRLWVRLPARGDRFGILPVTLIMSSDKGVTWVTLAATEKQAMLGFALSPDGTWMYLSTSGRIRRYGVNADGTLGAFTVFTEGVGIGDGQKTDRAGNLYSTSGAGPGIVRVTSPAGKLLGTINLPIYGGEPKRQICSTNEAFGGPDGRTLFIAGCDSVYTIQMKTRGK